MKLLRSLLVATACGWAALASSAAELNLFAWSEYVPQAVIDGFTKEAGIKVNYETFASGEEMLAKLLAGGSSYDLIQPPDYIAEALIKHKLLLPLNAAKLPNLKNIAPEFLRMPHDPKSNFTIPYMIGTVGIVVNTDVVKEPIRGYKDLFQEKYKGRIVALNDNRELVSWVLVTLGLDQNDISPANLAKVRPILANWIKLVKLFDSDSPKTALLSGDVDLGVVWSGEAARLFEEDKKFAYILPAEGAHPFVDVLAIPAAAANVDAAHQFLNYVLRPDVSKLISDEFPYTNPNIEARKLLTPEQLANPASYPKMDKYDTFRDIGKGAAAIDQLVTDLKSSQ
jgi:spermidine/putrescine transport system substrate-binding protein